MTKVQTANGKATPCVRSWEDKVQQTADMVGLIPILNIPAALISGLISLRKQDYVGVALSVAAMVPVEGEWAAAWKIARDAETCHKAVRAGRKMARVMHSSSQEVRRPSALAARRAA